MGLDEIIEGKFVNKYAAARTSQSSTQAVLQRPRSQSNIQRRPVPKYKHFLVNPFLRIEADLDIEIPDHAHDHAPHLRISNFLLDHQHCEIHICK